MASAGFAAFGSTLTYGGSPINELTRIRISLGTVDDVDISNMDSPDDTEEFVPGIIRTGTVDIEGNLVPTDAGQQAFITALQSRGSDTIVVTCSDAGAATFTGTAFPKTFMPELPFAGKASFTATLRVSGKLTFAP